MITCIERQCFLAWIEEQSQTIFCQLEQLEIRKHVLKEPEEK